ncbi:hypothetical protein L873DRAFT_431643 [Choiromyces venosus 120613-1]|uniref:Rhodopsin domain-containing protein n=1 Tax=Choiromyces venosus 120613-1 TaxID=1336337 RepID=A0A3N4IWK4_9PEZI|nr:hypothetical protein L873DRAFT_431643 [Choiromyces venosus 120613-1]
MSWSTPERGPDYVAPNEGPWGYTTATVLLSVASVVVLARIYCRGIIMKFIGGDDYCILFATATAVVLTVLLCKSAEYGAGKHVRDIPMDNIIQIVKIGYGMQILYIVVMTFTKASLLLLLIRLVRNRRMSILIWSIFGFMGAFAFASFWATVFTCTPPSYAWNKMDETRPHKGRCGNFKALQYWVPAGNILMDFVLWLLPLKLIYPLKLPRAQKIGLYIVFILGAMVFISATVRISLILKLSVFGPGCSDVTWSTYPIGVWSIVEATVGIICSSLPTLRPLFKKHFSFVFDLFSKIFGEPDMAWNQNSIHIPTAIKETAVQSPSGRAFPLRSTSDSGFISTDLFPDPNLCPGDLNIDLEAGIGSVGGKESRSIMLEMDITEAPLNPGAEASGSSDISRFNSSSDSCSR